MASAIHLRGFSDLPELRRSGAQETLFRMRPDAVGAGGNFVTEKVPCRHIPLNESDETIHSLYQNGTPEELEAA